LKKTVYIESSVVSYLTSKPSRDIVSAAYQQITRDWWETERGRYECFISDFVIDEIAKGVPDAASARLAAIQGFRKLALNPPILELIKEYRQILPVPETSQLDVFHLAISVGNGMDYVLSLHFKHIANAMIREKLQLLNTELGLRTPVICTPEELIGGVS
jgi:hypothetical protein